jgi:hypoxanthine phosphoribosyltransferase
MPSKQPTGRNRDETVSDPEFPESSDGNESDDVPENPNNPQTRETPAPFAHPSEADFARILDFYGMEWVYEPRSFDLRWDGDHVTERFRPDFYLPEVDLYIELTTLRQSLVTRKNGKVRRLKELHPEINIRLLYRKDYHRLLSNYGHGPLVAASAPSVDDVLFTSGQIASRVAELGREISNDYRGERPVLVGVLRGVIPFMADLSRQISLPLSIDMMSVSYFNGDETKVEITKDLDIDLAGRHVIMVEDIVDTGMTLRYLLGYLERKGPASLEVCAFLDKRARRLTDTPLKYVGFEVPDEFLVGYGLDFDEEYRNLPFIGIVRPDIGDTNRPGKRSGPK